MVGALWASGQGPVSAATARGRTERTNLESDPDNRRLTAHFGPQTAPDRRTRSIPRSGLRPQNTSNGQIPSQRSGSWSGDGRQPSKLWPCLSEHGSALVHVRGGVEESIFFYEFVPPGRIEGIAGDPWHVLPPPMPSEGGVLRSASSAHVSLPHIGFVFCVAGQRSAP